ICALADTLILDEDGVYDPAHYNDRLLLGLKGTLSEAELHVIKARLQGGILNRSERESDRVCILRGFPDSADGEEFEVADCQSLGLEQQVTQVFVAAPAIDKHADVPVDGFHDSHPDLGPAVVDDAVQVFQQRDGKVLERS